MYKQLNISFKWPSKTIRSFLINIRSDIHLIKIGKLNRKVKINEYNKRLLIEINNNAVGTINTVKMNINTGKEDFIETFVVVQYYFPLHKRLY